ncbi:MAG: hypothetical protein KDB88_05220 [Flavobacteriales bacterium]|nr:hypothetical protein [Flavobacteriales bacterium]
MIGPLRVWIVLSLSTAFSDLPSIAKAQGGMPFCVYEHPDSNAYISARHDANTGLLSPGPVIQGMDFFVLGDRTAFDTDQHLYHCVGMAGGSMRLYSIEVMTGSVIHDVPLQDNIVGLVYDPIDQLLYGVRVIGNSYDLISVDPAIGQVDPVGILPGITAYSAGTFTLDPVARQFVFVALSSGDLQLRRYRLQDASLVSSSLFPDALIGYRYYCGDSAIYAVWENGTSYSLERIDETDTHTTVANLVGVVPGFVAESASISGDGVYTFRGFDANNNFALISVAVSDGSVLTIVPTSDNATGFEEDGSCGSASTSIEDTTHVGVLRVGPNPTEGPVLVRLPERPQQVNVHNTLGQQIRDIRPEYLESGLLLDFGSLPAGIYAIEARSREGRIMRAKVVRQ